MIDQEYINSLSTEDLRRELTFYLEQVLSLHEDLLKLPEAPKWQTLYLLSGPAMNMKGDLWERGKKLQNKYGPDLIPYKSEYERAAGLWEIIREGIEKPSEDGLGD